MSNTRLPVAFVAKALGSICANGLKVNLRSCSERSDYQGLTVGRLGQ